MPPSEHPVRSSEPRRALSSSLAGALVCGVCFLLALAPCCGASSKDVDVTQAALLDNEYVTIPAKVFGESICLTPDTGADISYLDVRFRDRLGPPLEFGTQRTAFRDKAGVAAYAGPPLLVGETPLLPRLIGCQDMTMASMISGQQCDGILGMNVLKTYVLCFDFDQRRFSMARRVPEAIRQRATPIPLKETGGGLAVSAFVNGVAMDMVIDTGANGFLSLTPDDWQKVFPNGKKGAHEAPTAAADGEVQRIQAARVRTVAVGTNTYTNSIARLLPNGKLSSVLGNQFLSQHTAVIDFPGRMLYLVPGQHFGEVQEYDMSGLKLIKAPPAGATTVYSVDVGSPAFSAGLRAQDQVLSVSGQRAQLLGLKRIRQMLKAGDGDEVTIEASRQGETKEFKFHLKRFL